MVLEVLARRDEISDSLWHFIPAAAALAFAALVPLPGLKAALLLVVATFFLSGLARVVRSLFASMRMLWNMRYGFLAPGRMTTCRFGWERKRADMPYAPFLSNWSANLAESRVRSATGCLLKGMFLFFAVPFILAAVAFTALALVMLAGPPSDMVTSVGNFTVAFWAQGVAMLGVTAIVLLVLRGRATGQVAKYKQWRRMAHGDQYDANSSELVEALKRSHEAIAPISPLPAEDQGVELICRAEYMARGERVTGEGRVRLCNRLELSGIEPLLFQPTGNGRVIFLAGLPARVRIARGEWEDLPKGRSITLLAPPPLVAGATLAGFVAYVPVVVAMLR
ncbi:MAG: hypothetical protein ABIQ50_02520 [Usitatibacter sp.]